MNPYSFGHSPVALLSGPVARELCEALCEEFSLQEECVSDSHAPIRPALCALVQFIDVIQLAESQFDIDIPDEVADAMNTLGDLVAYLEKSR